MNHYVAAEIHSHKGPPRKTTTTPTPNSNPENEPTTITSTTSSTPLPSTTIMDDHPPPNSSLSNFFLDPNENSSHVDNNDNKPSTSTQSRKQKKTKKIKTPVVGGGGMWFGNNGNNEAANNPSLSSSKLRKRPSSSSSLSSSGGRRKDNNEDCGVEEDVMVDKAIEFDMESLSDSDDDEVEKSLSRYGTLNNETDQARKRGLSITSQRPDIGFGLEKMRARLRYFFMNPIDKWKTRRQFPYKLSIQLIKIFFVTFQLSLFASYRYASVSYTWDNKIAFSHIFIKDWDPGRETTSYPPTSGALAVYTKKDFWDYLDHAVRSYGDIEEKAIGPYFYSNKNNSIVPLTFCLEKYKSGVIFGFNESYTFDSRVEKRCIPIPGADIGSGSFSSKEFFEKEKFNVSFDALLEAHLLFSLKTVRFRDLGPFKSPDCFQFDIDIFFNNRNHDGQVLLSLELEPTRLKCNGDSNYLVDNRLERFSRSAINYLVIAMCTMSFILCCRAIYRAQLLKAETLTFFKRRFNTDLGVEDRLEFLNFWYLVIILNDVLIIIGSAIKEQIENKQLTGEAWNICSLLLGVGNLFVWFGVLRYLGFFKTYNVLILTLRRALPNVMRFLLCAILIYAGFTFCGWLILGPYHIKFSTLSTTSECLFALINGDDMFATFAGMSGKSNLLWWFCRLYLYTFIILFIYVVLSLFISLIMDAYETIKLHYAEGFPRTPLHDFVLGEENQSPHRPSSPTYSAAAASTCCHHTHGHHPRSLSRQFSAGGETEVGGNTSTAGGILDTIVETICGCHKKPKQTPVVIRAQDETVEEGQPLLTAIS